jgi:enamine deaminase RidA (YjgF/YER057c/UK114 family)
LLIKPRRSGAGPLDPRPHLQGADPASTVIFVAGLASPKRQVEIEAIAAAG